MEHLPWSPSEKRLARAVFARVATAEEAEVLQEFKQQANAIAEIEDLWVLSRTLEQRERDLREKYDYRYSQLLFVFGRLVREGRVQESELRGLSAEKLAYIRRIAAL